MKIRVKILSFIVLFLSTVPCSAYAKHSECVIEKSCNEHSQECGDECNGKCSPFYACGTCVGFIINYSTFFDVEKSDFNSDIIIATLSYDKFVDSSYICKIWQPPKTS